MMLWYNLWAIAYKELRGYFLSPRAYLIAAIFWLISGFFFVVLLLGPDGVIANIAFREQMGMELPPIDVPYEFLRAFFGVMGSLTLFVLPLLSMGLYADERRQGTLELLATSPIANWCVALGKLGGVLLFFTTLTLPFWLYEILLLKAATPPMTWTLPLIAHLALILLAGAILALGMVISALTDSSVIAALGTFGLVLALWLLDTVATRVGGPLGEALGYLSLLKHYSQMVDGVLDTGSLILFGSYMVFGVVLTAQAIEALRFQRA